jgi:hypothetical protein
LHIAWDDLNTLSLSANLRLAQVELWQREILPTTHTAHLLLLAAHLLLLLPLVAHLLLELLPLATHLLLLAAHPLLLLSLLSLAAHLLLLLPLATQQVGWIIRLVVHKASFPRNPRGLETSKDFILDEIIYHNLIGHHTFSGET